MTHFVKQYQDNQGLNYAFFSDMDISIEHALITVASPHPFNEDTALIWAFGYSWECLFLKMISCFRDRKLYEWWKNAITHAY